MISVTAPLQGTTREATLTDTRAADRGRQFSELLTARLDRAYRLAGLVLSDASEAEDAVGDAALRAWQAFGRLRDVAGFDAWFDRILLNVCRDRLRRRRRVRFIPLGAGTDRPASSDPFRRVLDLDDVLRTMRDLDDDERLVVVLHFWADLTLTDVAARIGVPVGTVKSRLNRALQRMRPIARIDALEEHGR
jgi:RNA polymerase sigma-70 factor, ECF subfamily